MTLTIAPLFTPSLFRVPCTLEVVVHAASSPVSCGSNYRVCVKNASLTSGA